MSSTIKSWIDVFSGKHRPVWLGNIDTDMKRGHGEPQLINLVNAGCQQAGPKILFDLSSRRSDCCNNLRDELGVSRAQTASSRSNLECPPGVNLKAGNIPETYNDITKSIIQGRNSVSVLRRMKAKVDSKRSFWEWNVPAVRLYPPNGFGSPSLMRRITLR